MQESQPGQTPQAPMEGSQPSTQEQPKKSKGSKWWVWLLIVLGIIVVIGVVGFLYLKQTPQYSLYLMTKAIENKDYNAFSKYFNTDAVIDDLLDKVVAEAQKSIQEQAAANPEQAQASQQYLEAMISQMRTQLKEQAKAEIKTQVEAGTFYADFRGALISSFLNTKVKISGSEADVTITNKETNQTLPLKMRKVSGYWEVYKINATYEEMQKLMQSTSTTGTETSPTSTSTPVPTTTSSPAP